jgi:hypothetical protein
MPYRENPVEAPAVVPAEPAAGFLPTKGLPAIIAVVSSALAYWLLAACSSYLHVDVASYIQPYVSLAGVALGIVPPPSAQPFLALVIGLLIGRLTPPSVKDMLNHMTDEVVLAAKRGPGPVGDRLLIVPAVEPKPKPPDPAATPDAPRPSGL